MIHFLMSFCIGAVSLAHDEGHGPKLSDTGKYGGLVSAVVKKSEAEMGAKADLVYKAELSRALGTIHLYLYDRNMKPLDPKIFAAAGEASLAAKVKGKWKSMTFPLVRKEKYFAGEMPNPPGRPYNIDVTLSEKGTELLSAFDNLD